MKLKRICSLVLALALLLWVPASAAEEAAVDADAAATEILPTSGVIGDGLTWSLDETTGTLTIEGEGDLYFPGLEVAMVEEYIQGGESPWKQHAETIKSVVIGEGVTSIGVCTFAHCTALESVELPSTLTSINMYAFAYCAALKGVTIPESVAEIGTGAFMLCTSLRSVSIPSGVKTVGEAAFAGCSLLSSVEIAEGVEELGANAFALCAALSGASIPSSVKSIGIGLFAFSTAISSVELPEGMDTIADGMFSYCTALSSIDIPSSVTHIGDSAFLGCTALTSIDGGENVESVGEGAFALSAFLTLQGEFAIFGDILCAYNGSDEDVVIPDGVRVVDVFAFAECDWIMTVEVPEGVTEIRGNAFYGCYYLQQISLPASLERIEALAFDYGGPVTSIFYAGTAEQWAEIDIDSDNTELLYATVYFPDGTSEPAGRAHGLNISWEFDPDTLTLTISGEGDMPDFSWEETPWSGFSSLAETVVIEEGITSIGDCAFYSFGNLTSVSIPEGVTRIGSEAFGSCYSLETVVLPSTATDLGTSTFCYSGIKSIVIPEGTTYIGEDMFSFSPLESITLPSTIAYIGPWAFTETAITSITLPEGLEEIDEFAFGGCTGLTSVDIPESVTYLGDFSFSSCYSLETVTGGEGLELIGSDIFSETPWLTEQEEYAILGSCLFGYNGEGGDVVLPDGITAIDPGAFYDRTDITSIVIPDGVEEFWGYMLSDCTALTDVYLPDSIVYLSDYALPLDGALTDIHYAGTEEQWNSIELEESYDIFDTVNIHFESKPPVGFTDVTENDWFHSYVIAAARADIVAGNPDGTFEPNEPLTWAQTVTFAVRLAQYNAGERLYGAADQTGVWYEVYTDYAIEHGIIAAVPEDPNAPITRADAAIIFAAVLGETEQINTVDDGYFTDVATDSPAYDAIYALARAGISNGKGAGEFGAGDGFLRCEVAAVVARMAGLTEPAAWR